MFGNNQQSDNSTNSSAQPDAQDNTSQEHSSSIPTFGLGSNPSTFSPAQNPVTLPTPLPPNHTADTEEPESAPTDNTAATQSLASAAEPESGDLADIKNQALQQLSPLVSKLNQTPEEKYKTLMMMIQASDNRDLVKEAYEAANAITDEKVRAEALLSIVNEINYFTQQSHS